MIVVTGKKLSIILAVFIFLFAILLIYIGFYFRYLSKPSYIVGEVLERIQNKSWNYLFPEHDVFVGDQFSLESSIDFDLDSEYYKNQSMVDIEALRKYNIIKNLSNLNTQLVMKHDGKNRLLLLDFEQKLGEEKLYHKKEYVANETGYYYVEDVLNQYVNNGTCNYFETIREGKTHHDNFQYLNEYIFKAIQNSLLEEDFKTYEVNTNIHGKEEKVHQISIRFTNKLIRKVWNAIILDFEKDEEASFLIKNIFPNYKKYLLKDDSKILSSNEYYTLNIYTTRFLYAPVKYEVIHMMGDEKEVYIYEGDDTSGDGYYVLNDQVYYSVHFKWRENSIDVKIKNSKGEDLGNLRFDKDDNNIAMNYSFEEKDKKYEVVYSSKYEDVVKGKSYVNTQIVSFNYLENKVTRLNGSISYVQKLDSKVQIEETVGDSILASKLTEEQKYLFQNKYKAIKERMEK